MAFTNRIRLPFKLSKPQFPEERQEYRKANGETVTLSVVIRKVYEGITDYMPEKLHERLKIALAHDNVQIEGDRYVGVITQEGSYDIEWLDFKDKPIAQAKFKAQVSPFNATNSNCGTCETYSQVITNDDNIGEVDEGDTFNVDVLANDSICCNPVTISLVTTNSTYVNNIVIEPDNTLTITLNTPLAPANGIILATYRAQCDNGLYDEANIIADVTGSSPAECLAPTNLSIGGITTNYAQATWSAPVPAPDEYEWELYLASDLVTPVLTGQITDLYADLDSLTPNTAYRFYVRSKCGVDSSNFIFVDFSTLPSEVNEECGKYNLTNNSISDYTWISYVDCVGVTQNFLLAPLTEQVICALQTSPGNPVDITAGGLVNIDYFGLC